MSEPATPAVILLDWANTLSVSRFWESWLEPGHPLRNRAEGLVGVIFGAPSDDLHAWMRGERSAEQVVAQVAATVGVDPVLALEGLAESCRNMRLISDEILPKVASLRAQGIRVGIATDNMDTFTRWTVPALGMDRLFDPILNSAELGALKNDAPDEHGASPFFGEVLADLEPGTRIFLVDDSVMTAPVVAAHGITFCHVTPERDVVAWLDLLANELLGAPLDVVPR